ncbi:MAG TPA: hypothetical protein VLM89_13140 [Phycisphaerae bacterium]|nr:hypothetical protein [Phycisphaerae bacterium]
MKRLALLALACVLLACPSVFGLELVRQKNVATILVFPIVDADGDAVTGAAGLDSEIDAWSDGTAPNGYVDCTNEATEIGTSGSYYLSLTQAECNVDYAILQIKTSTSGAKTQWILVRFMVGDPLNIATTDDGEPVVSMTVADLTQAISDNNDVSATAATTSKLETMLAAGDNADYVFTSASLVNMTPAAVASGTLAATIAAGAATPSVFTLSSGPSSEGYFSGRYWWATVVDATDGMPGGGIIAAYDHATKTVTLETPLPFTPAENDAVYIVPMAGQAKWKR